MKKRACKESVRQTALLVLLAGVFLGFCLDAFALKIKPQNIQSIAIYGSALGFGIELQPDQYDYNVADPSLIASLIGSIDFATERDCSALGSTTDAFMYIKYKDGSIKAYDIFGLWSHISKVGFRGSCYFISESGQDLFAANAQ